MATTTEEVNKPISLPPYSHMITAAIEALNDKNGSSKTAISNHILSKYGDLPESHYTLLADNLTLMKDSGELLLVKNNYLLPTTTPTPVKRGRGRPPKVKTTPSSASSPAVDAVVGSPRPRGRPPKAKDPLAVVSSSPKVSSGRGRGRPPKVAKVSSSPASADADAEAGGDDSENVATATATVPAATAVIGTPRPRGRPPKVKPQLTAVGV